MNGFIFIRNIKNKDFFPILFINLSGPLKLKPPPGKANDHTRNTHLPRV